MRVALFTETYKPYVSGVVNSIDMIKQGLEENGHEVYIICLRTALDENYIEENPNVIKFNGKKYPFKNLSTYYYTNKLKKKVKTLKQYNFDLVHVHTEFSAGKMGALYSKMYNVPLVFTYHTNYEDYLGYVTSKLKCITHRVLLNKIKKIIKFYQKRSSCFIVPTKKVQSTFERYKFYFPLDIIPTGIDVDKFNKENIDTSVVQSIKDKYNLNDKFVFCSIGRISSEKSIDVIIKAFAKANVENSVMLVCGTGPAVEELESLVKELNMSEKIIFTGMVPYKDIPAYYCAADVFLNASMSETQGLTYIESMAAGVPVLVRKDEALVDLLIPNKNGLYFTTEEELISNMQLLVKDVELLTKMKNECASTIANYTRQHYASTLEKKYQELIDNNK